MAVYGTSWRRILAAIIDIASVYVVLTVMVAVLVFGFGFENIINSESSSGTLTFVILYVALFWLYFTLLTSSDRQATLGKSALDLKVIDRNGDPLSFGRANARFWAKPLSAAAPVFAGFLMIPFTRRKYGFHDIIAGTFVARSYADIATQDDNTSETLHPILVFILIIMCFTAMGIIFIDDIEFRLFK